MSLSRNGNVQLSFQVCHPANMQRRTFLSEGARNRPTESRKSFNGEKWREGNFSDDFARDLKKMS